MTAAGALRVVISGCSGGGKSTLLGELAARGHGVVEEPGRRIVEEETGRAGRALPWVDLEAFLRRAVALSTADLDAAAAQHGLVFFDRGLVDAASALEALTGEPATAAFRRSRDRYHPVMFMAPPWPAIYAPDAGRRHGLNAALAEYERLALVYPALGFEVTLLPRAPVAARADFVLATLARRA